MESVMLIWMLKVFSTAHACNPTLVKIVKKKHCIDDEPCLNNGECNPTEDGTGYKCTCLPKFYGDRCENEYCRDVNPCLNDGVCTTTDKEYACRCEYGYGGVHCEIDVCYRFEIARFPGDNYYLAKSRCASIGGEIVSRLLGNDGVNYHSDIRRVVSSDGHELWVGISDQESEGSYRFTNGQPATNLMFSWGVGEPNDHGGNEDCVYFSRHRNG